MTALLTGRLGLVTGVANARSIAWGIAQAAHEAGASLILTYQSERLRPGVQALANTLERCETAPLDITQPEQLQALALKIAQTSTSLDFVVHAMAYAPREALAGRFVDTTQADFHTTLGISAYSLIALAQALKPALLRGKSPSLLTLTYLGSERAMPHYNVMGVAKAALEAAMRYLAHDLGPEGIRANALSAGPVRTLSAAGIAQFRAMMRHTAESAPLRRNVEVDEIAQAALFAISDMGRGMTGEVIHIDAGYHIEGAPGVPAAAPSNPLTP
jgi:enoyl-[acyl-carrier protein] reductase I